ncbi:MAG: NADH-quinone oxidoreductase subunit B [Gemmatimonadota bacterium]
MAVERRQPGEPGYALSTLDSLVAWGRKYSLYPFTFATACCGIEVMGGFGTHYDLSRFGAEVVRFSPRQADVLLVAGTVNYKMAPVLKRIYEQMLEPKWVVAMGACAASGGFYNNYTVLQGIDKILPVDVYIPGCPPNPEGIIDAVVRIQQMLETGAPRAAERWPIKI